MSHGQVITGGPAGISFSVNGTSTLVSAENGGKFTVTKPDGTTEPPAGITTEGQNTESNRT